MSIQGKSERFCEMKGWEGSEKRECKHESKKKKSKKSNINIHTFVLLLVPVAPLLNGENYTKGPPTPSRELNSTHARNTENRRKEIRHKTEYI